MSDDRPATEADVHRIAAAMPHVTCIQGPKSNPVYQVGSKSFVFFRTQRRDAPYPDVIVIWVESEADKEALVQDADSPFFTTPHFDGHPSVLVRATELHRVGVVELQELIQDAWLSQASTRRARRWLDAQG
ncbi:hypothetical protein TUM20984_03710 [Mycobacterium antarcticum]|nr:hypothetical protein TUM20984_03710 [Mycolicibacterium sp. TUM20984]